jgi:biotin-(acetyl-CoA carboxylase) ligase
MSGISDVEIMNIWRNNIDTIGKKIKLILLDEEIISGKVKDIDLNGDLVLNLPNNKLITIKAGMVKEMKISK